MFCPKCGTQNPDDFLFCRACGGQLAQAKAAKPVAVDVLAAIHLVVGILACVGVLLLGIYFVYCLTAPEAVLLRDEALLVGGDRFADLILPGAVVMVLVASLAAINLFLAWGIWKGKRLVYTLTWISVIVGCFLLIGIPIGVAEIVMLSRPSVKRHFSLISV